MKIREILKAYPEVADVEYYYFTDRSQNVHTDFVRHIDGAPTDNLDATYFRLMDEEEYNLTIYANVDDADFETWYGNKCAKVLIIILPYGWDEEKAEEEVTATKMEMARLLISFPGWDGLRNPEQLCKAYSEIELYDALGAYDIEFSGAEYEETELELTKPQENTIQSAHDRFDKKNTVRVSCKFNKNTDKKILEWLAKKESKQGAIKKAILFMIEAENS